MLVAGILASEPSFAFPGCQQGFSLQAQHMQPQQQVDTLQQALIAATQHTAPAKEPVQSIGIQSYDCPRPYTIGTVPQQRGPIETQDSLQASTPQQLADHLAQLKQEFKEICSTVFDDRPEFDHLMHDSQIKASLLQQVIYAQATGLTTCCN